MGKLKNPLLVYIGFAIFFIVGAFMLFMGFKSLFGNIGYKRITATVISVRTYEDDEGDMLGVPTFEYYVDGERYEHERSFGQSVSICPRVGETIKIRYNKNDPSQIKDDSLITVVFFIFGVVFAGVGGTMFTLSALGKIHWVPARRGRSYAEEDYEIYEEEESEEAQEEKEDIYSDAEEISEISE